MVPIPRSQVLLPVLIAALILSLSGCLCGPRRIPGPRVRLEYEIQVDQIEGLPADGPERARRLDAVMDQTLTILRSRLEYLGDSNVSLSRDGVRLFLTVPVGPDGEVISAVRSIVARRGRLEFRIVDDEERVFYEKLRPMVEGTEGVRIIAERESLALEASDRPRHGSFPGRSGAEVLEQLITDARAANIVPPRSRKLFFGELRDAGTRRNSDRFDSLEQMKIWRSYLVHEPAALTGEYIAEVSAELDEQMAQSYVSIRFNPTGRELFARVTGRNIKRRLAIIFDERVNSAPVIQEEIGGGTARITLGGFDVHERQLSEARELSRVLEAGELAAPLVLLNEVHIGS